MSPVLAVDPTRRTNARAIADVVALGWLDPEHDRVLDLTVGPNAGFWKEVGPKRLTTNDANPRVLAHCNYDARHFPNADGTWDVVCFDPPYGYRGTSRFESDAQYGIAEYHTAADIDALLCAGTREAMRLTNRLALIKCQDQNVSSIFHDQQAFVTDAVQSSGGEIIGKLYVNGVRKQPAGKVQKNVWGYWSVLLIAKKGT